MSTGGTGGTAGAGRAGGPGGAGAGHARSALHKTREVIRRHPKANLVYRTTVGVAGTGAVALGVVMIPLPGPGSLIALGGLALLGTEFEGAKKTSTAANKAARKVVSRAKEYREERKIRKASRPASSSPE